MKKIILSLTCFAVLTACNNSSKLFGGSASDSANAVAAAKENAPAFKFEKESYDFGQITQGEKVTYDFKFKNIGKSPLIITNATATCGCTTPEYPKGPVAPGENGMIHVVFNSATKSGMQNKIVTITANTVPSTTEVHLIGDVKMPKTN